MYMQNYAHRPPISLQFRDETFLHYGNIIEVHCCWYSWCNALHVCTSVDAVVGKQNACIVTFEHCTQQLDCVCVCMCVYVCRQRLAASYSWSTWPKLHCSALKKTWKRVSLKSPQLLTSCTRSTSRSKHCWIGRHNCCAWSVCYPLYWSSSFIVIVKILLLVTQIHLLKNCWRWEIRSGSKKQIWLWSEER